MNIFVIINSKDFFVEKVAAGSAAGESREAVMSCSVVFQNNPCDKTIYLYLSKPICLYIVKRKSGGKSMVFWFGNEKQNNSFAIQSPTTAPASAKPLWFFRRFRDESLHYILAVLLDCATNFTKIVP